MRFVRFKSDKMSARVCRLDECHFIEISRRGWAAQDHEKMSRKKSVKKNRFTKPIRRSANKIEENERQRPSREMKYGRKSNTYVLILQKDEEKTSLDLFHAGKNYQAIYQRAYFF